MLKTLGAAGHNAASNFLGWSNFAGRGAHETDPRSRRWLRKQSASSSSARSRPAWRDGDHRNLAPCDGGHLSTKKPTRPSNGRSVPAARWISGSPKCRAAWSSCCARFALGIIMQPSENDLASPDIRAPISTTHARQGCRCRSIRRGCSASRKRLAASSYGLRCTSTSTGTAADLARNRINLLRTFDQQRDARAHHRDGQKPLPHGEAP